MPAYTLDLTGGKTYSASDSNSGLPASNAFDNNESTMWHTATSGANKWIAVDFGSPIKIQKLRIKPFSPYGGNFDLQGSNDGTTWTTIMSGAASSTTWHTFEFVNTVAYRHYRVFRAASNYFIVYEIEMMAVDVAYAPSGTYTLAPIDVAALPTDVRLKFLTETPANTSVTAEYAVTEDGVTPPISWTMIETDAVITLPDPATGFYLWLLFTLATTDSAVTPAISAIWLEEAGPDPNKIQINLTDDGRMKHPQGMVTVAFNGSLAGPGSAMVAPFTQTFAPVIPTPFFNPNDVERISLNVTITSNFLAIAYLSYQNDTERISLSVAVTCSLIHVNDIQQ